MELSFANKNVRDIVLRSTKAKLLLGESACGSLRIVIANLRAAMFLYEMPGFTQLKQTDVPGRFCWNLGTDKCLVISPLLEFDGSKGDSLDDYKYAHRVRIEGFRVEGRMV